MTQFIEIEGEVVRVVDRSVVSTTRLEDLLPHIERRPPVSMMLPRTAVYAYWDESDPTLKTVRFLCEIPPALRAITKSNRRYRLAMPWTYFILGFETAHRNPEGQHWSMTDDRVFHTNARVTGPDSRLWTAFLPNVYEDGRICFGSTGANVQQPLPDRVDALVNGWYLTNFNNDVHGTRRHPLPFNGTLPNGWRLWVDATAQHGAAAWTTFPEWTEVGGEARNYTLRDLMSENLDRLAPLQVVDAIPDLPIPATFGRSEQWLRGLNSTQRGRLFTALLNLQDEDPELVAPAEPVLTTTPTDDGGEPV